LIESVADDRAKWLRDRQKNDWVEGSDPKIESSLSMSRFLGVFGQRNKSEEKD